jgi:hypothetical protein
VIVYVWGSLTADNFTPRPGKDTVGRPGQTPGLSASSAIPEGRKAQGIDLNLLRPPLKAFPDDPTHGGSSDHFAIAPANETGEVDIEVLNEWASHRKMGTVHALTQLILDAVAQPNVKGE